MISEPENEKVAAALAALAPEAEADVPRAWERFRARRRQAAPAGTPWFRRPAWIGLVAVAGLVGALGFSPRARLATARMLSLFRVSQVAAVPVDFNTSPLAANGVGAMVRQMLHDEVVVTGNEPSQSASDLAQAATLAGFALRYPAQWSGGVPLNIRVRGAKDFRWTVDRDRAAAILTAAGLDAGPLPANLDGATLSVHLPRAVTIAHGNCPDRSTAGGDAMAPASPPSHTGCTVLIEGPSPEVSLPPGLDVTRLASLEMQLLGMSPAESEQYAQTIDWTSTLVVPVPRGQAESNPVEVDGVQGLLLTKPRSPHSEGSYMLLWSRQGILYAIMGAGTGGQGLTLAGTLTP